MRLYDFLRAVVSGAGAAFSRRRWRAAAWVLLGCAVPATQAQGPVDAALRGRVVGADGAPLAGAHVWVRTVDGSAEREVTAAADGGFVMLRLAPGEYGLRVEGRTAASAASGSVLLFAGETSDVTLRVGVGTSLPVAARGLEFAAGQMERWPVSGRLWEGLAELDSRGNDATPAAGDESNEAEEDRRGSDEAVRGEGGTAGGLSYAGMTASQNAEVVDGLAATQAFGSSARGTSSSGLNSAASYGQGAVRSFRVLPRSFSAQYGGAAGGLVAVVSERATERLHASAFVLSRQSAWAAANPFSVVTHYRDGAITNSLARPSGTSTQAGGAIGFPLAGKTAPRWRRDAGAFVSAEGELRDAKIVATPALASFYALSAEQTALLANRGVSAAAINSALDYLDSLTGTIAKTAVRLQEFARVDIRPSPRDALTLASIESRYQAPAGLGQASDAVVARGMGSVGDEVLQVDVGTARWLHRFSQRFDNEVRGQVAHDLEYETAPSPLPQEPAIGPRGLAPQVSIGPNGFAFGTPSNLGRFAYPEEQRVELADAMQLRLGTHLLRAGAEWSRLHDRVDSLTNAVGSFSYDSGVVAGRDGGLADWITDFTFNVNAYPNGGCPGINAAVHYFCFQSFTQSFGPAQTEFVTHEVAGFAEDSWRVRDNLVLSYGARYEYTLLPLPQAPNATLDAAIAGLGGRVGGTTSSFPEDRNNLGPRVSAEWSPQWGKGARPVFTARVGLGVFYGRIPGAMIAAGIADTALASTTLRVRITPATVTQCPQVTAGNQGFGYPCDFVALPPAAVAVTSSAKVFARDFRTPAVQRAALSLEREVGRRGFVRASYAMANATQLPTSVDLNIAPSTAMRSFVLQGGDGRAGPRSGETFVVPMYASRLQTQYGPVSAMVSNANATYHAGTVEAEWRMRGLEARGSYTFSRAIDYGPQQGAVPGVDGQFDPFADGYDKGLSSLQFPQRFAGDLIYADHVESGPEWRRRLLDGWRFASIATAGSGAPYSYAVYGGSYLSAGHDSLNGSGGATYLPTVGRNTLRLPVRGQVDLRVGRDFALRGRLRVDAFAQAFNLLNESNISRVETRAFIVGTPAVAGGAIPLVFQDAPTIAAEGLTTPAFGTALSSSTGLSRERRVEVGLRVEF